VPEINVVAEVRPATSGLALGIVALAGAVDAITFLQYKELYVSFMSGNTTALSVALVSGQHDKTVRLVSVIGLFVLGVLLGAWLHQAIKRQPATAVLALVAGLLLLAYSWAPLAIASLALGMGMLNTSVSQLGSVSVGLTYVTGALVKVGTGLASWLSGQPGTRDWQWQALGWGCFLVGGTVGALGLRHYGAAMLAVASSSALLLAVAARRVPGA
jgi:uncharacterized membrane protein YoaK (UPF0700 family)